MERDATFFSTTCKVTVVVLSVVLWRRPSHSFCFLRFARLSELKLWPAFRLWAIAWPQRIDGPGGFIRRPHSMRFAKPESRHATLSRPFAGREEAVQFLDHRANSRRLAIGPTPQASRGVNFLRVNRVVDVASDLLEQASTTAKKLYVAFDWAL